MKVKNTLQKNTGCFLLPAESSECISSAERGGSGERDGNFAAWNRYTQVFLSFKVQKGRNLLEYIFLNQFSSGESFEITASDGIVTIRTLSGERKLGRQNVSRISLSDQKAFYRRLGRCILSVGSFWDGSECLPFR